MRRVAAAAAATVLVAAAGAHAQAFDRSGFEYVRDLPVERGFDGTLTFEPDGPMFAHARVGFGDVRIFDADGTPVPWRTQPDTHPTFRDVRLLNSGRQGRTAVALLDLGARRALHDRVVLRLPERPFVGRATVLGADRRDGPFTTLATTGIYDVRGARRARSTTVVFPTSDHRFLLIRARGVSRILGASVARGDEPPLRVGREPRSVTISSRGRDTVVRIDLGYRRVPVDELRITATTPRYDRPVTVEASNDGRRWAYVSVARVSRFEGSSPGPIVVGTRSRYLRAIIENGDDLPLRGVRVELRSRSHALVIEGGHKAPYRMYYGAPGLRAPNYEFARLPLRRGDVTVRGALGAEQRNPAFDEPERPFGERHGWILSAALAAAAAVVAVAGFLALRRRA